MRLVSALALAMLTAACATRVDTRPIHTMAALEPLPTAELAAQLLPGVDPATIERHTIGEPYSSEYGVRWSIFFRAHPRPVGEDVCARDHFSVPLFTISVPRGQDEPRSMPARVEGVYHATDFALAPGCRDVAGRQFARLQWMAEGFTEGDAVAILRWLAFVRAAAAGTDPLPFRLSCESHSYRRFECPADLRATLAALPLDRAATIERRPRPNNCLASPREEGDAVEIGNLEHDDDIWDVRLRHMGTAQAEIVLIRQFPRTRVEC
jgi:hypothetical protein